MHQLGTLRTTEAKSYNAYTTEQTLKPGEIVPLEIEIWSMGLMFDKDEKQ